MELSFDINTALKVATVSRNVGLNLAKHFFNYEITELQVTVFRHFLQKCVSFLRRFLLLEDSIRIKLSNDVLHDFFH